jgi:hypothetical protein
MFLEAAFTAAAAPTDATFYMMCMRSYKEVSYIVTDG